MKGMIRILTVLLFSMLFASLAYADGWISDSNGRKYMKHDGSCYTNEWFKDGSNGKWYYFGSDGYMVRSQWIGGTYYVDENGEMLTDAVTPDLYYVHRDGKYYNIKNERGQKVYTGIYDVQGAVVTITVVYPDKLTGSKSGITHVFLDDFGLRYGSQLWCGFEYISGSSNGQYRSRTQTFRISRTVNGETTTSEGKFQLHAFDHPYNKRETAILFTVDVRGPKSADGKVHVDYIVTIP